MDVLVPVDLPLVPNWHIMMPNRMRLGFNLASQKDRDTVSEYVFKLKKGDLELELKSDDSKFIETQMDNWRNMLITQEEK